MRALRRPPRAFLRGQQFFHIQPHAVLRRLGQHSRPVLSRDPAALAPFVDHIRGLPGRGGKRLAARPAVNQIGEVHARRLLDYLSRRSRTMNPVTTPTLPATLCPAQAVAARSLILMPKQRASDFDEDFIERTRRARIDAGYTQETMGKALGMLPNTYSKYESRSPLPHRTIPLFCALTRIDPLYLFTGQQTPNRRLEVDEKGRISVSDAVRRA